MKNYFISGTGTGVGKTLLTCTLTHQLQKSGKSVRAIKPVISGFDEEHVEDSDTALLLSAQSMPYSREAAKSLSPWRFKAPLSPDMAAQDEKRSIEFDKLIAFCRQQNNADYLLVEGVGGVMVPLGETHTVLDWMEALAFPVILVGGSYLGALSHALTAASALLSRGLTLHAVIISESAESTVPLARTQKTLARFLPSETHVLTLGRLDSSPELWKDAPDLLPTLFI